MKKIISLIVLIFSGIVFADTVIISDSPSVVRNAEIREAIRLLQILRAVPRKNTKRKRKNNRNV